MGKLADWLQQQADALGGTRALSRRTGIRESTLSRLINGKNKKAPYMATLVQLSETLSQPLADLVEWSGAPLGLPDEDDALVRRLQGLAEVDPQVREILDLLHAATPEQRRAVLAYLRGAQTHRPVGLDGAGAT